MTALTKAILIDDGYGLLAPLRDLRPIFDVRTGPLTIRERLAAALGLEVVAVFVPEALAGIAGERAGGELVVNSVSGLGAELGAGLGGRFGADEEVLVVNGRCALPLDEIDSLGVGCRVVEPEVKGAEGFVAARVLGASVAGVIGDGGAGLETEQLEQRVLMSRPWHVRSVRDLSLQIDMRILAERLEEPEALPLGVMKYGDEPVLMHPSARIYPGVTFNTEGGPVVLDENSTVRPGAIINGPVYVGPGSTVLDQSLIKGGTSIGPICKVAGEVGGTVIQGLSNKAHDGHLGDSWLGEWVNLGAGTTNSNLLNTYGVVKGVAEPGLDAELTGETFFGCVLGDHVKAAIGTRIMTGAIVHTGTMWAAGSAITGGVGRFMWASDKGVGPFREDKFVEVMRAAMGRRKVEPSEAYLKRVSELHAATHG